MTCLLPKSSRFHTQSEESSLVIAQTVVQFASVNLQVSSLVGIDTASKDALSIVLSKNISVTFMKTVGFQ
jgi:hypothetical protein